MELIDYCDFTNGWNDTLCSRSIGGIRRIVPVPISKLDMDSLAITDNEITALDLLVAGNGGYEFVIEPELSSYTDPINRTDRGAVTTDISLNMVLNNDTKELREILFRLAKNRCVFFVEKSNQTWVALGLVDGLRSSDGNEGGTGVTKKDPSGHSLNYVGTEMDPVPDIDETLVMALLTSTSS